MIIICPNCNQRVVVENDCTDFIHQCNSGVAAVDNEDVLKTGDWEDYTGSGTEDNIMLQGSTNKFWGTRAAIEGEREQNDTKRGKSDELYRTRRHEEFIKIKGGNK